MTLTWPGRLCIARLSYRLLIDFRPKSFKSGPVSLGRRFFHGRRVPTPSCSRESAVLTRSPGRAFRSLRGDEARAAPLHWTARGPGDGRSFLRTIDQDPTPFRGGHAPPRRADVGNRYSQRIYYTR